MARPVTARGAYDPFVPAGDPEHHPYRLGHRILLHVPLDPASSVSHRQGDLLLPICERWRCACLVHHFRRHRHACDDRRDDRWRPLATAPVATAVRYRDHRVRLGRDAHERYWRLRTGTPDLAAGTRWTIWRRRDTPVRSRPSPPHDVQGLRGLACPCSLDRRSRH